MYTDTLRYRQCVAGRGRVGGVELCYRPYSAGVLHFDLTRFRTYKSASQLKQNDQLRRHLRIGVLKVPSSMRLKPYTKKGLFLEMV
jgi:hypothetical protein